MKDYKAECEKLRGQLHELEKDRNYYRDIYDRRMRDSERLRDTFKELLVEVLGR